MLTKEQLWEDVEFLVEALFILGDRPDDNFPETETRYKREYHEAITELHDSHGVAYYKIGEFVLDKHANYKKARGEAHAKRAAEAVDH